jgi:excisionase family DNA binding protein
MFRREPRIDQTTQQQDVLLTVEEVAHELRCSKPHTYKMIRGIVPGVSRLPAIALGRRRLVRRSALEQWMRDNEQAA